MPDPPKVTTTKMLGMIMVLPLPPLISYHGQVHMETQRWGSAFKADVIDKACLWDAELRVGMCGDFCKLSSAAGAISSGLAMAEHVTKAFQ